MVSRASVFGYLRFIRSNSGPQLTPHQVRANRNPLLPRSQGYGARARASAGSLAVASVRRLTPCHRCPRSVSEPPLAACSVAVDGSGSGRSVYTRRGNDWTTRYRLIVDAVRWLRCRSCLIHGEAVVTDLNGLSDFEMLRSRRHDHRAFLYAFDLVELNGRDLRGDPIEARKDALAAS
jgi:hypothetical protein